MKQDVFPQTLRTWIGGRMVLGDPGRADVNRHLMEVYLRPLKIYYLGTGDRWLGDADDVIQGFFADRLSRETFVEDWMASGLPLRRWLCNGLCFYLHELRRARRRDGQAGELSIEPPVADEGPRRAMDRAFIAEVVQRAIADARERCEREDLREHWEVFEQHHCRGRSYHDIGREMEIKPARAAVMARTASKRFREAIRDLVARDTPNDNLDVEILALLESDA